MTTTSAANSATAPDYGAIANRIAELAAEYSSELVWSVRFDKPGLPVGHIFPASRVWSQNGRPTPRRLKGTSAIRTEYLHLAHQYETLGAPYIVCGYRVEFGNDPGEVVLSECEIMA